MRKIQLLLSILLFSFAAWGQDSADIYYPSYYLPEYQQIKKDCSGKQGARYYAKLVKRFEKLDTTLDITDLQKIYYGQPYLDNYSPYGDPKEFRQIREILNKEDPPSIQDTRDIIKLSNDVIARCPAEPRAYYYKFIGQNIACELYEGDTNELEKIRAQFHALFQTIASTGNGLSPELAMHVVSTSHEYMMMNMYGFQPVRQALMHIDGHSYDMFVIDSNEYDVDTLYFNIDCIVGAWDKLFPQEKKKEEGPVTTIDLKLGTKFVLEMKKVKRKNSRFVLVEKEFIEDTLIAKIDSLFAEPVPENQIVGYFCPMRLYEGSESVWNCLVFRSNCDYLFYDTYISREGVKFNPTSNNGMPRGTMMNEMWHDDAQYLRISNLRTKE
ncbi:MAG: DUF4919 domain-containing protein [Bacteroidales bacterium]|nr:DUF4919 domain-containing protein [Bacteroidales bacterium]